MDQARPPRPAKRADFEIAVICALTLEADAVDALLDHHWDDDDAPPYGKADDDPNAYTVHAATMAVNCRKSFPNVKLALVVGICGAVPFYGPDNAEIILGDVIISDGVIQYDFGRRLPERFVRKDTLLDALGRPSTEVRALLAKLKGRHGRKKLRETVARYMDVLRAEPDLAASYPGTTQDRLFEATYRHVDDKMLCKECGCSGKLVPHKRLGGEGIPPQPVIHFGLIASGDAVI
ncbi:hypothetical protein VTG60DRAFT_6954 [Thermothelomyces hinnuleus]